MQLSMTTIYTDNDIDSCNMYANDNGVNVIVVRHDNNDNNNCIGTDNDKDYDNFTVLQSLQSPNVQLNKFTKSI